MRSVLIFTTAGKTFASAKTAGSEAGSACANPPVNLAKRIPQVPARVRINWRRGCILTQQVTENCSYCQLAQQRNSRRLKLVCGLPWRLGPIWIYSMKIRGDGEKIRSVSSQE